MEVCGSQTRVLLVLCAMLLLASGSALATSTDGSAQPAPPPQSPSGPPADFVEDFDSYAAGSNMHGQGGWKGWDNNGAFGAFVVNSISHSSPNSVDIAGPSDLVHEFSGFTSSQWTFSAWSYVPGSFSGTSYVLLLNTYNDGGPYNWSTQIQMDSGSNMVISDFEGNMLPLVRDQWVQFVVDIDLDGNSQSIYYDGALLSTKSWTEGVTGAGAFNIGAVDLFANNASSVFWDDVWLCPLGVACGEPIPTVGGPGLALLALLLMAVGLVVLARRRASGFGA